MVEIERWMEELAGRLAERFGPRLLFLGLQGSYGRGEANEDSDIDVVTVLDRVELSDLDLYRAVVGDMPEGEKACGFLCGAAELESWPKYDLCQLARDTRDVHGRLKALLPTLGPGEGLAQGRRHRGVGAVPRRRPHLSLRPQGGVARFFERGPQKRIFHPAGPL